MEKIKILHVFRNLEMGGAQKLIIDIYKNINKDKICIIFATICPILNVIVGITGSGPWLNVFIKGFSGVNKLIVRTH